MAISFRFHLLLFLAFVSTLPAVAQTDRQRQTVPGELAKAESRRIEVMERASAATIAIFGQDSAGGGSGVIISPDGFAVTNFHVAQPCGAFMRCGLNDGQLYDAVVVGLDPTGDIALIQLVGRDDFPVAPLANSDKLRVGQPCFAAGNPFLLATDFSPTLTLGIISGLHRYQYPANTLLEYTDCIQTDAAINPGNSGGPLFNLDGEVIGINGRISIEKRGRVNVGVGYAISINQVKKFMGYLRSGRIVDHATLGFTVSSNEGGAPVVTNILDASDAYRRGIRFDDEIVSIDGRNVDSANELQNIIGTYPKGWRVQIAFRRDGQPRSVWVRLQGAHASERLLTMLDQNQAPAPAPERKPGEPNPDPEGENPLRPAAKKTDVDDEIPESLKSSYEQKRGFANYHYNREAVQRIYGQLSQQFGIKDAQSKERAAWRMQGMIAQEGNFTLEIRDDGAAAELPSGPWSVDSAIDLDTQLSPDGSGGMLLALYLLRDFILSGPATFGDVVYSGTLPHYRLEGGPLVDSTIATRQAAELHIMTDTVSGALVGMELIVDSDKDSCEIEFSNNEFGVPKTLKVWHGDSIYGVFQIERFLTDYVD